ncbi:MAG: cyclophilin-like fold protein [Bacteroidales bacterium]|nr:cyclophilin-like fold protein [Bacteroidales bacterium]
MKRLFFILLLPALVATLATASCSKDATIEEPLADETTTETETTKTDTTDTTITTKINLIVGGQRYTATLENNGAARDLLSRLPLEVTLEDFNRTEKIFYPEPALSLADTPRGCAPKAGDITIYRPWGNIAIFYKDWPNSSDLILVGHVDDDGLRALQTAGDLEGVRFEAAE